MFIRDSAKYHGFITDEDKFLDSITERQDICLNMTKLKDDEIMNEIKEGGKLLNEKLNIGLSEDSYIRTKGYKTQRSVKMRPLLNPKKIKRNTNDMSFNYSQTEFKFEEQNNP